MFLIMKKEVNDRQRLVLTSLKVLFTFEEGVRCSSQTALCSSHAEIEILAIFLTVCCTRARAVFLTKLCHIKHTLQRIINMQSVYSIHVINEIYGDTKSVFILKPCTTNIKIRLPAVVNHVSNHNITSFL